MGNFLTGYVTAIALIALAIPSVLSEAQGADRVRSPAAVRTAPELIVPTNVPFGELRTIYVASGVTDDGSAGNAGVATVFHCTNVSGVTAQLRFLVLDFDGTIVANSTSNVAHAQTFTAGTHNDLYFINDATLSPGTVIDQGVVNIEADQSAVFCNAVIVDAGATVPIGNALHLTRVNADPSTVDQPLPANVPFGELRTIYVASGVTDRGGAANTGNATSFLCTNVSGVTAKLRYLVLNFAGFVRADATFDLPHTQTHTASTHGTVAFREDADLSTGVVAQGAVNIESDQSAVFCSAMLLDASTATPAGIPLHLTRVNADPGTQN